MNKNKNFNEEASEEYCLCGVVIVWGGEEFPNQVRKYSLIIRQRDKDIQHTSVINEFRGRRGGKTQEWVGAPSAQKRQRKECKEMNDTEVRSISRPKFFREDFARKLSLQKRDAESVLQQDLAWWHSNCPSGHQHDSPSPPLSLRGGGSGNSLRACFPPFFRMGMDVTGLAPSSERHWLWMGIIRSFYIRRVPFLKRELLTLQKLRKREARSRLDKYADVFVMDGRHRREERGIIPILQRRVGYN